MMLCDLTDADVILLYSGSDPEVREGWNIIKLNRFLALIDHFDDENMDATELFNYVEKRNADLNVQEMMRIAGMGAANDG